jgi:AsmA protein
VLAGAGLVLVLFVLFHVVAPSLISSSLVRQNMERVVAGWTGHSVSIAGPADIRFWPKPRITLRDVTIRKPVDGGERTLAHVNRLSAGFDLLGALWGDPQFKDFNLTEAQVFVVRDASGRLDWANSGLLSQAVRNVQSSSGQQVLDPASDADIGVVKIRNGMLEVTNQPNGRIVRLEAIEGSLDWPSLSRSVRLQARASFAGRPLDLDIGTAQPLLLLSGRSADTLATVSSDLFSGSFSGVANLASHGFLSGDTTISAPDFPALLQWAKVDFPAAADLRTLSLQSRVISSEDALRFENLTIGLNGVEASGILDLTTPAGNRPRVTGTLAIGSADFSPLLRMIGPGIVDGSEEARQLRSRLEIDVRLSAQQATLGAFEFDQVALGIMNIGEQSRLDILDSDFEGGRLTGRVATIKDGADDALALRLTVHDADFGSIFKRLALQGPVPAAHGSMELALDVARPLTAAAWRNAKGSVHFSSGPGSLPGVDMPAIRTLAAQGPYFSLSEASKADLAFQSIDVTADVAEGAAEIRKGEMITSSEAIELAGVVPYVKNSLALSWMIRPVTDITSEPEGYFIGGSWPDPVIWRLPQVLPKPAE